MIDSSWKLRAAADRRLPPGRSKDAEGGVVLNETFPFAVFSVATFSKEKKKKEWESFLPLFSLSNIRSFAIASRTLLSFFLQLSRNQPTGCRTVVGTFPYPHSACLSFPSSYALRPHAAFAYILKVSLVATVFFFLSSVSFPSLSCNLARRLRVGKRKKKDLTSHLWRFFLLEGVQVLAQIHI